MGRTMDKKSSRIGYDSDGDGVISNSDIKKTQEIIEIENLDKKEDQQRRMAWIAMASMVFFTALLFLPWIDTERIQAIDNILGMFYIAQAGVVATFFGSQAYMSRS
jgi:hypothetical protein